MSVLRSEYGDMTLQQLVNHYERGQLNLEPGFQRDSVWTLADRRALIDSIFAGLPLPSIFLYKRQHQSGGLIYDVIDGKQRLESVFMFMGLKGFRRQRFDARTKLAASDEESAWYNWRVCTRRGANYAFLSYKVQTVEVSGDLSDIVGVFVRINSTGKKLTSAEKRHAKYYNSPFLRRAGRLAARYKSFFQQQGILSARAISRMKHVEITCELLASVAQGGPLNKKKSLDDVIGGHSVEGKKLDASVSEFVRVANLLKRMFPKLRETRFANAVDFYSLFMLIHEMDRNGLVLKDKKRNAEAQRLLIWLTQGVDQVRQLQRKAKGAPADMSLFAEYLMTVQGDTDSQATRGRRARILRELLAGIFERRDDQRSFSPIQRRIIWHSAGPKRCAYPGCGVTLDWTNFTVDHVVPHALGGRTSKQNAALMCRRHNSKKGARPLKRASAERRRASKSR